MNTKILKLEEKALSIVKRSKERIKYFGKNGNKFIIGSEDDARILLLKDIQETYENIPSIYNQKTDLSPENIVLRSIIINMFNYNFWGENEVLPNSSILLETIYSKFNTNKTLNLFYGNRKERMKFISKIRKALDNYEFKCKEQYHLDIDRLKDILLSKRRHHLRKQILKVINGKISIQKYLKFLSSSWPSYGKDIFFKREILSWYFIKDIIPDTLLKKIPNEELYFPIDYRLPSSLNHMNYIHFPERFDKYFNGSEILKSKSDEMLIRAVSFLTLINLNRWLKLDAHKLDFYFFNKSRILLKSNHLKFKTTDY